MRSTLNQNKNPRTSYDRHDYPDLIDTADVEASSQDYCTNHGHLGYSRPNPLILQSPILTGQNGSAKTVRSPQFKRAAKTHFPISTFHLIISYLVTSSIHSVDSMLFLVMKVWADVAVPTPPHLSNRMIPAS